MKTQANQLHKQQVRITGIAMAMSRAAAIAVLMAWTPSSIGSANHDSAPARLPAVPAQAAGTKAVPAVPGHGPGALPTGPMCAERGVLKTARFTEGSGESAEALGCGIGNNLAGGTPARTDDEERVDVATLLAWHVEGRNLGQDVYQTTLSGPSRTNAQDHRASALTVTGPFWTTIAR
jgi:hypothetical protein